MTEYIRLLEIVENRIEIRKDSFGSVIAAKIHNREEFDLMVSFWVAAHSSCCTREKIKINGAFVGTDWYFIESETADYGMDGKSTTYFTQTLTEKKQKFWEFCRKFDVDEPVDAVSVKHGHWVKVTNGRGGHECSVCHVYAPLFKDGSENQSSYCPLCGAKMDESTHSNDYSTLDALGEKVTE